jgi:uncharacterized protein YacL
MIEKLLTLPVNWLAILASAIATMVVGFVWYGVFAKKWSDLTGWTTEKVRQIPQNQMMMSYGGTFVGSLVMNLVLAHVLLALGASDVIDGVLAGVVLAIGFVGTSFMATFLFEHRPRALYFIDAGYHVVSMAVCGAILALWK